MHSRFSAILSLTLTAASAGAAIAPSTRTDAPTSSGISEADQRLLSELSRRQLGTLLDYAFKKYGVPEAQRSLYLALGSLRQIADGTSTLPRTEQQQLVSSLATDIDQVIALNNDPRRLLEIAAQLTRAGAVRPLNTLEYWGENLRTQGQLRPIAEAIDRLYAQTVKSAQAHADDLANQLQHADDPRIKEWEALTQLAGTARFNSAFHKYTLALSMDRTDPRRQKAAEEGLAILKEFEDPQFQVQAQVRWGMGKLDLAIASKESLPAAKKLFAQVLADANANWNLRFEAAYFSAVADLIGKDLPAAKASAAAAAAWLSANPPATDDLKRSTEAALIMLDYRLANAEAEVAHSKAAGEKAIAILQSLMSKRPDLAPIINEQLIARLPDDPSLKSLSPLLLKAILARGDEEIRKADDQALDKKMMRQAVAAAQEMISRGTNGGLSAEDLDVATLELGLLHSRLGQDQDAAAAFLDHMEKYPGHSTRRQIAFENAAATVAKLRKEQPGRKATEDLYFRFLQLATAAPFNHREYSLEFGRLLLDRNVEQMKGSYSDAQRQQMLASAREAADVLHQIADPAKLLYARYFEMLAHDQTIDLLPPDAPQIKDQIRQTQDLADQVNAIIDKGFAATGDRAARDRLRWFRVRTCLLAADLAKHDRSDQRQASMERALKLLANFEKDVEGMNGAANLLGEALFIRINVLMSLGRTDEALAYLGRFLETRTGDDGIRIVYEMLESLNKEFQQAQQDHNDARAAELAGNRAKVSGYLVDRVARSSNEETRKLLPKYRMFEAAAFQQAASLDKDAARRNGYLNSAMAIFEEARKSAPEDRGIILNIALVQYDLGNYAAAQPVLVKYLSEGLLGKPKVPVSGPDGEKLIDNNQYWDAMQRLLRCNIALAAAKAPGFDPVALMDETRLKLKQLYIQWGVPGGPRWSSGFDEIRKQILPDWSPPALGNP